MGCNHNMLVTKKDQRVDLEDIQKLDYDDEKVIIMLIIKKYINHFVVILSIIAMLFHLWRAQVGVLDALLQRPIHLMFMLLICFLGDEKYLNNWRKILIYISLAIISIITCMNMILHYDVMTLLSSAPRPVDILFGILLIIAVLEACRRAFGWALPIIAILFLIYALLGPYFPSPFDHRGYSMVRLISFNYLSTLGLWSIPLSVAANIIILFIFLGAILEVSSGSQLLIKFAMALVGSKNGGPAKVAIVSSTLMGTITGNSAANVAMTGSFTIPLMKEMGFSPELAGAIEAVASTCGQIIPPIMGAAAFIMVTMTGIPYTKIMIAAIIPSLFYITVLYSSVHFSCTRARIMGLPKKDLPDIWDSFKKITYLLLPIILLVYLLVKGRSIIFSIYYTCIFMVIVTFFRKSTRMNLKKLLKALEMGARKTANLSAACACAGIIVGVVGLTGLGLRFSEIIITFSGGNLLFALFLTMTTSLILGMGLPTSACYIMLAVIATPLLIKLGISVLPAHFFVFYFGCLSAITPPIAIAAYTGAAISGGNQFKTGLIAMKISLGIYIVPYLFVTNQTLILWDNYLELIFSVIFIFFALISISSITQNFLLVKNQKIDTILLFITIVLILIQKNYLTSLIGIVIFMIVFIFQYKIKKLRLRKNQIV